MSFWFSFEHHCMVWKSWKFAISFSIKAFKILKVTRILGYISFMVPFQMRRSKRDNFLTNFLKLIGSYQIDLNSLNTKFQEKIFTTKKVIKLWNFGNFGIPKIIAKSLVTLRFLKISLQKLKGICKCIQMRYRSNFYVDLTYSNTCFFKIGKWRVLLQGTAPWLRRVI